MSRTRALLTETERDYLVDDEIDPNKRYQAISRIRNRIRDEMPEDVAILRETQPELYEELKEAVSED